MYLHEDTNDVFPYFDEEKGRWKRCVNPCPNMFYNQTSCRHPKCPVCLELSDLKFCFETLSKRRSVKEWACFNKHFKSMGANGSLKERGMFQEAKPLTVALKLNSQNSLN